MTDPFDTVRDYEGEYHAEQVQSELDEHRAILNTLPYVGDSTDK